MSFIGERYDTLSAKMIEDMEDANKKNLYKELWKENVFWSVFGKGDNSKNNNDVKLKKTIHRGTSSNNSLSFCSEYKYKGKGEDEDIILGQLTSELKETKLTKEEREAIKKEIKNIHELKCQTLIDAFHIKKENQGEFIKKFQQAVSGSGQELNKITTLHSSSLCALLFFYNVTKNNTLVLRLNTNKGERIVEFTESLFEFKNRVISDLSPSNVDIVLVGRIIEGKEGGGKDVVLFLENKFAEYFFSSGGTCDIGKGYLTNEIGAKLYEIEENWNGKLSDMPVDDKRLYNLEKLKGLNLQIQKTKQRKNGKEVDVYKLSSEDTFYIHGIKQMISHYIGIKNLINGTIYDKYKSEDKRKKEVQDLILSRKPIVILGEIVFKLPFEKGEEDFEAYEKKYEQLAIIIAKIAEQEHEDSQFEILKDLMLYSQITKGEKNNYKVDEKVKLFYGMN